MASTSETGHAKNASNFEELITTCISFGPAFNPSKPALKISALTTVFTNSNAVMQTVKVALTNYNNATNAREIVFKPVKALSTRIVNSLASTDATEQTIDDAKSSNTKIQGKRAKPLKPPAPGEEGKEEEKHSSVSQLSFNNIVDHFAQLVETLKKEPEYKPNEIELKIVTLDALLVDLKAKNTAALNATVALKTARIARDTTMYKAKTGLVSIAKDVKKYVKSLFGPGSPQFKQLSILQFINVKGD
jgi:hypothetical protein